MISFLRPRRLLTIAALTAVWCGLWGELSAANALAGAVIAVGVTAIGVGTSGIGDIKAGPLLRLTWIVLVDLIRSTIGVAVEIMTPTDRTDEAIIAVSVPPHGRDHFLLLVVAITLTPGTAVVDADPETGTLFLHLLHQNRRSETIEHVQQLARLACQALPTTPIGART